MSAMTGAPPTVRVRFTANIQRHTPCPPRDVPARTLREALDAALSAEARGYFLDERGALRRHIAVFVNGEPVRDRVALTDALPERAEVDVMQALSGG